MVSRAIGCNTHLHLLYEGAGDLIHGVVVRLLHGIVEALELLLLLLSLIKPGGLERRLVVGGRQDKGAQNFVSVIIGRACRLILQCGEGRRLT